MDSVDVLAKKIWEYMLMHQELEPADAIFVLGSNDRRLADYAAELFNAKLAPIVVCSGGLAHQDDVNNPGWGKPEGEVYKERLVELGVPSDKIFVESESKSTGDNVIKIRAFLENNNLAVSSAILVHKPTMERRAYATFRKQWPELKIRVTSPKLSYEEFMSSKEISKEVLLNVMVGDLLRIREYPKHGFQIEQIIPEDVWFAGQELFKLGYDKYAIKN